MVRAPVKVAFYIDEFAPPEHVACANLAIDSVRKAMPHAEVWELTTPKGPALNADQVLRHDVQGPFGYRRTVLCSMMTGNTVFLDTDVLVMDDVSSVFDENFDVAVTTDMKPGADWVKYNGGVVFCRNPEYWRGLSEVCRDIDFRKESGDWETIEKAWNEYADSVRLNVKRLPGEVFNYVPNDPEDKAGKIIHFRGNRRAWMFPIKGFESGLNTSMDTMLAQAEENLKRELPLFVEMPQHSGEAIIVGGGPSLQDCLPNLRMRRNYGGIIFALNGAHDWLIERGIVPDFHVLLDARPENVRFVQNPNPATTYLVAAQCHPSIFDALKGFQVTTWISCTDLPERDHEFAARFPGKPLMMIGGGATVGLKTLNLAYLWGFRRFQLYGFDSSYRGEENHAYRQDLNDGESRMEIYAAGKHFTCAPWMAKQAQEFQQQYRQLVGLGCIVKVHGDGLIPHIANQLERKAA